MYFKEIDMAGFKSFADRTKIKFDTGVTAIVGPNGCGKSNVSDAIRWVLGEQSSKTLRGSSMQDVIFSGTEKRKSLSYCEVTVNFENSDRFFSYDYDELSITRKLYRSGESEYLINRAPCRLKDITNILFDSGVGKDGYSIIGQGQVQKIVDSKPEDRRVMFEEAAGISKFKARKVEAERKLERTRENLVRLKDIISEIDRQLGPLKKQAEVAKKYLEYKNVLKDLEVNAYIYQYENASVTKAKIKERLDALKEELNLRQNEFDNATSSYDKGMLDLENFDKLLNSLHDKILELTVNIEKQAGETKIIRERINYVNIENDRLHIDLTNSQTLMENLKEQYENKNKEDLENQEKLKILEKSYDELSDKYLKIVDDLTLSEDENGRSQKQIIEAIGSLSDIKSALSRLSAEKELLENNKKSLEDKINQLSIKEEVSRKSLNEFENKVSELEVKVTKLAETCKEYSTDIFLKENKLKDIEQEKHNKQTEIQVFENRRRLLTEMQAEYEGYASSVKKILRESERNSAVKSKIVGVLASLIKVPEKYETAIEVALGAAVQNIVTFNEDGAKGLIEFLKQNQFGRATFLPITSMKRRNIDSSLRSLLNTSGCFGMASELINYDSQIENVVSNLLGATVIVENLEVAVRLAREARFAFKIVTLDGDVVNPQGSMTGGSRKSEAVNLISREREIETLATEIEKYKKLTINLNQEIDSLSQELKIKKEEFRKLNDEKSYAEIELAKEKEKLGNVNSQRQDLIYDLDISRKELDTITNKLNFISQDISSNMTMQNALSGNKEDVDLVIQNRQEEFNKLREERDQINSNMTSVKVEIAKVKTTLESDKAEKIRIEQEINRLEALTEEYKDKLNRNNKIISDAEALIEESIKNAPTSEAKQELDNVKIKMQNVEIEKLDVQAKIKELDAKKSQLMEEISKLNDKKYKEELNLSQVDIDIETMQERIYEEYELTYSTCQEFKRSDFDINIAMPEIGKLKKQISTLGYVNVNAIEDSKVLYERYDELNTQAEDLTKAEEDLNKIIKDLSTEMVTRFDTEFNKINENFKVTFKELFGGGNARLELVGEDGDNPLEAGVDIVAEPPGKKLQNISLLSGGEKALTAIAILFAILKLKPLPFCLLDEIEAALDDANVERFAQYLRRFSKGTQFIVITHRKPTMELADSLYGVTMEEKGVSKMVSVKLSEAVKLDEEAM